MLGGWKAYLFHDSTRSFECRNGIANCALHASLHAGDEVFLRQSESLPANCGRSSFATRKVQQRRIKRAARTGGVMCIGASNCVEQERCIVRRASEWPDLIERRCKRDDAVARNATVGRLHANDASKAGRLTNRAARVGSDGERGMVRRNGSRRSARRSTRHAINPPRVDRLLVCGELR